MSAYNRQLNMSARASKLTDKSREEDDNDWNQDVPHGYLKKQNIKFFSHLLNLSLNHSFDEFTTTNMSIRDTVSPNSLYDVELSVNEA